MLNISLKEAANELDLDIFDLVSEVKNDNISYQKEDQQISFFEEDILKYKINNLFQYQNEVENILTTLINGKDMPIFKLENMLDDTINFLLEHEMITDFKDNDELLNELEDSGWLTVDDFCRKDYYETALEIFLNDEDEIMERWAESNFYSRPRNAYPSLIYAIENGLEDRAHKIIDGYYHCRSLNLSKTVLELCQSDCNPNPNYFEHLLERVDITDLDDLPEIHLAAISNNNEYILQKIADGYWEDIKENELNLETAEVALGYAVDANDQCLIEEIKEVMGVNDPEIEQYSEALELIHNLKSLVSKQFKIKLPDQVNFVEKKGNYATINYQAHNLEDDYGTETRT